MIVFQSAKHDRNKPNSKDTRWQMNYLSRNRIHVLV